MPGIASDLANRNTVRMKKYTTSSIRDLGAVADLTQALVNGRTSDNIAYVVPLPNGQIGSVVTIGTLSGIPSPFDVAP